MKDEIVSHKTSKLAKDVGFDEDCNQFYFYDRNKDEYEIIINIKNKNSVNNEEQSSAPTQSLLLRWLREEHNIVVEVTHINNEQGLEWLYELLRLPSGAIKILTSKTTDYDFYKTYEEALEAGLFEALKLIKNENN